jgi:hypothetical protein
MAISGDIFCVRHAAALEYLTMLQRSLQMEWTGGLDEFNESGALVLGFALIHPAHYSDVLEIEAVLGPRIFAPEIAQGRATCGSALLWGYHCPLEIGTDNTIVGDHLFPYALGGPTVPANKILLCARHNSLKGCDVHVFPWERRAEPEWLRPLLARIAMRLGRQRAGRHQDSRS